MSLERQNFLPIYLRPWVLVRPGFETTNSRSANRRSPNWANQPVVDRGRGFLQLSRWKAPINRIKMPTVLKQPWFRREEIFFLHAVILNHKFCGHRFGVKPTVSPFPWLWLFLGSYFRNNFLKPTQLLIFILTGILTLLERQYVWVKLKLKITLTKEQERTKRKNEEEERRRREKINDCTLVYFGDSFWPKKTVGRKRSFWR